MIFDMAVLHKEFNAFDKEIKLTDSRKEDLKGSRKTLRKTIKAWFKENRSEELSPKFWGQGSFEMNTTVNPIPEYDEEGNKLLKYDLDYGVYFIEKEGEDNRKPIQSLHDDIYDAVQNHTKEDTIRKTTCIRVVFADGHHIDLPIYYMDGDVPELAHRSEGWIDSDPRAFTDWFNSQPNLKQLRRIVRYLKAWKNYQGHLRSDLKLPSGFQLTILAVEHYTPKDNDDEAFRLCVEAMSQALNCPGGFQCLRPTTPKGEDVFADYSETRKKNFLNRLSSLVEACQKAEQENNFKTASEYLIKEFGDRFPKGEDKDVRTKSRELSGAIAGSGITHKPYHG
jgi:hypothetical protein